LSHKPNCISIDASPIVNLSVACLPATEPDPYVILNSSSVPLNVDDFDESNV